MSYAIPDRFVPPRPSPPRPIVPGDRCFEAVHALYRSLRVARESRVRTTQTKRR